MTKPKISAQEVKLIREDMSLWPRCKTCGKIIHWEQYRTRHRKAGNFVAWSRWIKNAKYCSKKCANDRYSKGEERIPDADGKPVVQGYYVFRMERPLEHNRINPVFNGLRYMSADMRDEKVERICQDLDR